MKEVDKILMHRSAPGKWKGKWKVHKEGAKKNHPGHSRPLEDGH